MIIPIFQAKIIVVRPNRNRLLVRNRIRRWCSSHVIVAIEQLGLRKFKTTSTTAASGAANRRAECNSLGPGLEHASLRSKDSSSLAAKRRAEALHVVFFSTKHPSPVRELLLCVYSRMIRSHLRRVRCFPCSLRSEPASTDSER